MAQVTPKHIRAPAQRRSGRRAARTRRSVEIALVTFAVVLAALVFMNEIRGTPDDTGPTPDVPAGPTGGGQVTATPMAPATTSALLRPPPGEHLPDPGFEHGLGAWRALAGELRPNPAAHSGDLGTLLTGADAAAMTSGPVAKAKPGDTYVATVWVRAERAGTDIEVRVVERVNGAAFATDVVGAVAGTDWKQIEVIHTGHRKGGVLELQVAAAHLGGGAIFVDDASLRSKGGAPMPGASP